ncbi:hypothetical protein [Bizionia arctica]|uniref:Uncharacterized protein n=1 Tax=Bizionia arctica TaxID=1495645 RepID=A0A917GP28_9FLAO|nr:hypothetical protein [Bizionia arctica]GGG52684.1 hypothetical protein GCM10010976_24730 [Bizionia arctica]
MKTRYTILALSILVLGVSCKNESPNHSTADTENPMNEQITKTTNYKEEGNFEEEVYTHEAITDSINEHWNLDDPERQQGLYSNFEMTTKQQQDYEKALQAWLESDMENPYDKLSASERIDAENIILKPILDESQYTRYKAWAKENDKR